MNKKPAKVMGKKKPTKNMESKKMAKGKMMMAVCPTCGKKM